MKENEKRITIGFSQIELDLLDVEINSALKTPYIYLSVLL